MGGVPFTGVLLTGLPFTGVLFTGVVTGLFAGRCAPGLAGLPALPGLLLKAGLPPMGAGAAGLALEGLGLLAGRVLL